MRAETATTAVSAVRPFWHAKAARGDDAGVEYGLAIGNQSGGLKAQPPSPRAKSLTHESLGNYFHDAQNLGPGRDGTRLAWAGCPDWQALRSRFQFRYTSRVQGEFLRDPLSGGQRACF
jgi:hypothetical protein